MGCFSQTHLHTVTGRRQQAVDNLQRDRERKVRGQKGVFKNDVMGREEGKALNNLHHNIKNIKKKISHLLHCFKRHKQDSLAGHR